MKKKIAVISGDGIGPEITAEAIKVLKKVEQLFDHNFTILPCCAGGVSIERFGEPLTEENFQICKESDAILLGNIGGTKWQNAPIEKRPERVLFRLRGELGLSVNIRPVFVQQELKALSPLKEQILAKGLDTIVIRDVTGGSLPSEKYQGDGAFGREAFDKEYYNEKIIRETARWAFETAQKRRGKVTSLDKANGLISSALWRTVMSEEVKNYPDLTLEHKFIDNCALDVLAHVSDYDVIVAPNLFGDIISDELAGIVGAIETLPSATLCSNGKGMYEPNQLHNTNYEIIGKNIANPLGLILSVALMFRHTFKLEKEAQIIEKAVQRVLQAKYVTKDIYTEGTNLVGTKEMGTLVAEEIKKLAKE